MKAILCMTYGSPDVLQYQEVAKPTPKDNQILVRVRAAVVGPADAAFRKGDPFIVRLIYGLNKPRLSILGTEFAGDVEAVGSKVTRFRVGDAVMGMSVDFGAHGEYLCVTENQPLVHKPATLTYDDAVGLLDGSPTAMTFLRDVAHLQSGQRVLINGASGAVGSAAVQIAKSFGAIVTGVCSTRNVDLVKSLGADFVIDYTQQDFTQGNQTYAVVYDAIGKSSFTQCRRILTSTGVYMTTVPTLAIVRDVLATRIGNGKKAKFTTAGLKQNPDKLNILVKLYEAGKLKPLIDTHYPLAQVPDAHRYVDSERKRGSVIIHP